MEKQGRIYYVDRELNETEVVRDFEFPCMFFVKKGNEIVKQITYDLHGVKSVATLSDEKKVLGDQITCSVIFNVNALGDKNKVYSTLGIVYSQKVKKNWSIPAQNFTAADDTALFVYAKCSKTTDFGSIEYTAEKKVLDEDDAFYFLLGTLHAPVAGLRIMSLSAGTATVDGGLIKLGIISSLDGQTTFNLNTGEITGKITFAAGSPAQTYVDNQVGIANAAAAAAQATADAASVTVSDIGNDDKLTPNEKQQISVEWNRIKAEYSQYNLQAANYGVVATAYNSAYNALNIYITPLLANLTTTSDIVGATFRANFNTYYTQAVIIITAVENARVDAVQVGGRNLIKATGDWKILPSGYNITTSTQTQIDPFGKASKVLLLQHNGQADNYVGLYGVNAANTEYTFSCWLGRGGGGVINWSIFYNEMAIKVASVSDWTRVVVTFTSAPDISVWNFIRLSGSSRELNGVWLFQPKLEKGNRATDWTPAPEDIDEQIATSQQQSATALAQAQNAQNTAAALQGKTSFLTTDISGNVVATGTVAVGDVLGGNAGITGVTDRGSKSVRFWAGVDYGGKNMAGWLIRDDGVQERWFNGVLVEQSGVMNGHWQNLKFNLDGVLAKKEAIIGGKITDEWYNEGILVMQVGQNGIYYVAEIPESYTAYFLLNLQNNQPLISNMPAIHSKLRSKMLRRQSDPTSFILGGDTDTFLYNAGQNPYAEMNRPQEGFKYTKNQYDTVADGWYSYSQLGEMQAVPNSTLRVAELIRLEAGKIVDQMTTQVETAGYSFIDF